jgi:hypothetical protein
MRTAVLNRAATILVLGLLGVALVIGSTASRTGAADHLDAPSLGSLSVGSLKGDRDINDVYVFPAAGNRTVLAMTTNPAVNVPAIDPFGTYGTNVQYRLNVDNTGDFVQDVSFVTTFGVPDGTGAQHYTVKRYTGAAAVNASGDGMAVASGFTDDAKGKSQGRNGVQAFAGERSDPFFFDLIGFRGTLGLDPGTTQRLCSVAPDPDPDQTGTDFFAPLNTLAIVLEVPDASLGTTIGVWADTRQLTGSGWTIVDQMGRPAINTVFNSGADKESFNVTPPSMQDDAGQPYRDNVKAVLAALGGHTEPTLTNLANALIPDVITYGTASMGTNILNGRALADDVIDAELNIVTQGGIPSDCVPAHGDYLGAFPYLGNPH